VISRNKIRNKREMTQFSFLYSIPLGRQLGHF